MARQEDIARALAFFEQSRDERLLEEVLHAIQPRAAAAVRRYQQRGRQIPAPEEIAPAPNPATEEEALQTLRSDLEFGQLQAIARAAGRRLEALRQSQA